MAPPRPSKRDADEAFVDPEDEEAGLEEAALEQTTASKRQRRKREAFSTNYGVKPQARADDALIDITSDRNWTKHGSDVRDGKSTAQIFSERDTQPLRQLKTLINAVNIKKWANRPAASKEAVAGAIDDFFDAAPQPGRAWQPDLREQKTSRYTRWLFCAKQGNSDWRFMASAIVSDEYDRKTANTVNVQLAALLNRWPAPTVDAIARKTLPKPLNQVSKIQGEVLRLAEIRCIPSKKLVLSSPKWLASGYVKSEPVMVNPQTYELYIGSQLFNILATDVKDPASIPEDVRFQHAGNQFKPAADYEVVKDPATGDSKHKSGLPKSLGKFEEHREKAEQCEQLARAFAAWAHGRTIHPDALKKVAVDWLQDRAQMNAMFQQSGVYGSKPLCSVKRDYGSRRSRIVQSTAVRNDITGDLPPLSIRSVDRRRVIVVENAISNTWLQTGNIKEAWLAGAEVADKVNDEISNGVQSPATCACSSEDAKETVHGCGSCGKQIVCATLRMGRFGLRVCKICFEKEVRDVSASLVETTARRAVLYVVNAEAQTLGVDTKSKAYKQTLKDVQAEIQSRFSDPKLVDKDAGVIINQWPDGLAGTYETLSTDGDLRPNQISVDGVFPYGRGSDGKTRIHCAENAEITKLALNFLKWIHLPGILHVIMCYLAQLDELKDLEEKDPQNYRTQKLKLQKDLIQASAQLRRVRLKFGFTKAARTGKAVSPEQMAADQQQFRAGKLRPEDVGANKPWNQVNRLKWQQSASWTDDTLERVKGLVKQIQDEFEVYLQCGEDACPWIGIPGTMPDDWSWKEAAGFSAEHLNVMILWCNGIDDTIDTPDMIFVVIILTICIILCIIKADDDKDDEKGGFYTPEEKRKLKARYSEFLGLPFVADRYDALSLSVAHAEHGMQMATGWKFRPETLADWSDARNNMLIETRASNYFKGAFPKSHYPALQQMIRDVRVPKKYYDRTIQLGTDSNAAADDYVTVKEEDALNFEDDVYKLGTTVDVDVDVDDESLEEDIGAEDEEEVVESAGGHAEYSLATRFDELQDQMLDDFPERLDDPIIIKCFAKMEKAIEEGNAEEFMAWEVELQRVMA